jgi:hypothetical protein
MKMNWKSLVALALIVVALYWAVDSVRPRSYSGSNLNFAIGSGPVMVTNPADEPVSVQLVGTGTRSFSVTSTIEGVPDASTREGSGRNTTQLMDFALPPGASEFTVARGTNVNFVAGADNRLVAVVQPQGATEARTTVIVAAVVILGALFYISRTNGHRWIPTLGRQKAPVPVVKPLVEAAAVVHGQGHAIRSYGDNRAET